MLGTISPTTTPMLGRSRPRRDVRDLAARPAGVRLLPRRGDDAELLQQAELVKENPGLGDLAVHHAFDVHPWGGDRLAGGGDVAQRAELRAGAGPARHHRLLVGDLL